MTCETCAKPASVEVRKKMGKRNRDENGRLTGKSIQLPDQVSQLCQGCYSELKEFSLKYGSRR